MSAKWAEELDNPNFEVTRHVVRNALKKKDVLLSLNDYQLDRKNIPSAIYRVVDVMLKTWILSIVFGTYTGQADPSPTALGCRVAARKARDLLVAHGVPRSDAAVSKSWITRFLQRNNLSYRKLFGESSSVNKARAEEGRTKMREITRHYHPNNIFNFDESAYFFRKLSQWTIAPIGIPLAGVKADKSRVTMAVGANATGTERLPLLIIGTANMSVPFHNMLHLIHWVGDKTRQPEAPIFHYAHSKKGWMNGDIFRAWLRELDERMRAQDRHILLLVDNVSSHRVGDIGLSHVRLEFLPKNTTSMLQPMDQGVIKATKDAIFNLRAEWEYEFLLVQRPIEKPYLFLACVWCALAFARLKEETIKNAWKKADIVVEDRT